MRTPTLASLLALVVLAACGGGGDAADAHITQIDARTGCDPATALPTEFRPIAEVSTGMINVTNSGGTWSGTIDATAGGLSQAADNPYIYVDLKNGVKVAIDDLAEYSDTTWDIALKRASLRSNGGDSGPGGRSISIAAGDSVDQIATPPTIGYTTDDFATDTCAFVSIPGGEPMSAFGEWYDYDDATHVVTPKAELYVIARPDGSHTVFRVATYYGDGTMPMRGAFYQVEWKDI
jgi:hypothetical protein